MGLRKQRREIAKARMAVIGLDRINKRMSYISSDGLPNWRKAITGDSGKSAHKAQLMDGLKRKQREDARKSLAKRKIRKVTA